MLNTKTEKSPSTYLATGVYDYVLQPNGMLRHSLLNCQQHKSQSLTQLAACPHCCCQLKAQGGQQSLHGTTHHMKECRGEDNTISKAQSKGGSLVSSAGSGIAAPLLSERFPPACLLWQLLSPCQCR